MITTLLHASQINETQFEQREFHEKYTNLSQTAHLRFLAAKLIARKS